MQRIGKLYQLVRHFGPAWLAYRSRYAFQQRTGMIRARLPAGAWSETPLSQLLRNPELADPEGYTAWRKAQCHRFFFAPERRHVDRQQFTRWDGELPASVVASRELARGTMRFFGHQAISTGFPPEWHVNPATGQRLPSDRHWSRFGEFDFGDIKLVWEPSRFSFVFDLVRAYWRTSDDDVAERFWQLVENWRTENPPQYGANWKCGQEVAMRVLAWCFGLHGFLDSPATTPARVAQLGQMIAVSARRIEANVGYAISQRNNHGISEAAALWTVGCLFPEFRHAEGWQRVGRLLLEREARSLIGTDGAFSQHSMNYHRLMLQTYLWSMRLAELQDVPFSPELYQRIQAAGDFLDQVQDEETGRVPNYGQNDGALLLPLNDCDATDFRPVVQSIHYLANRSRRLPSGAWDEDLLWLFGPEALDAPVEAKPRRDFVAPVGGYYTLRGKRGFVFTRAPRFRHRPSQADVLHVDVWWRGLNVALDAGTYSYNAAPPWNNPLAHTRCHNTVTVDDHDQMQRQGRFLWLPWLHAYASSHEPSEAGHLAYWEGRHDGYQRLTDPVLHRRGILRLGEDHWLVVDHLVGNKPHAYRLHWLLADLPYQWQDQRACLALTTDAGAYAVQAQASQQDAVVTLVRADQASERGWQAPNYFHREPALSLAMQATSESMAFGTLFGPSPCALKFAGNDILIDGGEWEATIQCAPIGAGQGTILREVAITGQTQDHLRLA